MAEGKHGGPPETLNSCIAEETRAIDHQGDIYTALSAICNTGLAFEADLLCGLHLATVPSASTWVV